MKCRELPTPALLLDRVRLERNLQFMSSRARSAGVDLRPHLKTAKSATIAALATRGHSGGITVSTLAEASYFASHGFTDITYAVCMVPARLDRAFALQASGAHLTLLTDSVAATRALDARAAELQCDAMARSAQGSPPDSSPCRMLIEIDSGEHRTGVAWDGQELLDIAHHLASSKNFELAGVLTHAGQSYACRSIAEIEKVAEEERQAVVGAATRLREAGFSCPTVSAGSTPTAVHARTFEGLTEIRPGVYMFFDLAQLGRQSCRADDIALSVLATVLSHRPEHGRIIIDAGGLALSKDTSAGDFLSDAGHGWICDASTAERIGDLRVAVADQEHGYVEGSNIPYDKLPIGSLVRVLPNHACMTAAAYDRYAVIENDEVIDWWSRNNGWTV